MKKAGLSRGATGLLYGSLLLSIYQNANALSAAGPLSEADLSPMCNNKEIWGELKISAERCLEVAMPCSQEIATKHLDWDKATEELYSCVFSKLGVDFSGE